MDKKTITGISNLIECKFMLTKERFFYYYQAFYNITDFEEVSRDWKLFSAFPVFLHRPDESKFELLNIVMDRAVQIVEHLQKNWEIRQCTYGEHKKDARKIFYKEQGEEQIKEIIVDFYHTEEITAYAKILERSPEIVSVVDKVCDITYPKNSRTEIGVFEGDIFSTNDSYWNSQKSRVFIARGTSFRHLLYIKGKGYLKPKGSPNIDEDENAYSDYAVTGTEDFHYLGNIITHSHVLKD